MVTTVYLVRHCHALGNEQQLFQGRLDLDLSDLGEKQLDTVCNYFKSKPLDAIYSSPQLRAKRTAGAVSEGSGCTGIQEVDALKEMDFGVFEGMPLADLGTKHPEFQLTWDTNPKDFNPKDGETMLCVYTRAKESIMQLAKQNQGKEIAVVSHGCVIRNFLAYGLGRSIDFLVATPMIGHGTVAKIEIEQGDVVSVNMINIQAFV